MLQTSKYKLSQHLLPLVVLFLLFNFTAYSQNPVQVTLSATTNRQPAKSLDTISYRADLSNLGDTTVFNVLVNRKGDANTTFVPGSFQSTPVAVPAAFANGLEDATLMMELQGVDPDGDTLAFTILQAPQQGVLSNVTIVSAVTAQLNYQPDANFSGSDEFIFSVSDEDGNHDTSSVLIQVQSINDAPSFTAGDDIEILEDAGVQNLSNWANNISPGPANENTQALTFQIVSNDNPDLFVEQPTLNAAGTLVFNAKEDTSGTATLVLQLQDDGGTANGGIDTSASDTFNIIILPVNDAPSFTKGGNIGLTASTAAQSVPNWATDIKAGPADEQDQILIFIIESNDNPTLFSEGPQISADGTLTFTPAPDAVGIANISIRLKDDGGTANGGIDVSDIQIFSINLEL